MQVQGTGPTIWLIPIGCNIALRTTTDSPPTLSRFQCSAAVSRPRAMGWVVAASHFLDDRSVSAPASSRRSGPRGVSSASGSAPGIAVGYNATVGNLVGTDASGMAPVIGCKTVCWFERGMASVR